MNICEAKLNGSKSKLVMEYMDAKRELATVTAKTKMLKSHIEVHMNIKHTDLLYCGEEYVEQTESPIVSVDAMKFKKLVSEDVFNSAVNVPVASAKKVLSEKELSRITIVRHNTKLITGSLV